MFAGKTPKGVKKKPRRRHKKGKGSPSGLGHNKKGAGNSSTVSARTDVTQSMHLSDYTCIPVASTYQVKMDLCLSPRINLIFKCLVYYNIVWHIYLQKVSVSFAIPFCPH